MTISNKLTIFRLVLILPIIFFMLIRGYFEFLPINHFLINFIIFILFTVASITDYYDGKLARERNEITDFGKLFDPLADKILVFSILLVLLFFNKIDLILVIILLCREFYITGYRALYSSKGKGIIQADILGKYKTVLQMVGLSIILLFDTSYIISSIIILPSVVLSIISAFDYVKSNPLN